MVAEKQRLRVAGIGAIGLILLGLGTVNAKPMDASWDDACQYIAGEHRDLRHGSASRQSAMDCGGSTVSVVDTSELAATSVQPAGGPALAFQQVPMVDKTDTAPLFTPEVPLILDDEETGAPQAQNLATTLEEGGNEEDGTDEPQQPETDTFAVPEPSAAWLMLLGVFALLGMRREHAR